MQPLILVVLAIFGAACAQHGNGGNAKSGSNISTSCTGGTCRTCVNDKCYDRSGFQSITSIDNCPVAACENDCNGMVFNTDNCPICSCNGFSTRELCSSDSDCASNGKCTSSLCRYPAVPDGLPKVCNFAYECPETDNCVSQRCQQDSANRRHLLNKSCVFAQQCPSKYTCDGMTCWSGGQEHTGDQCVFDYQCPTKYSCKNMTCVFTGKEHGTTSCVLNSECPRGQTCTGMTCQ